VKQRKNGDKKKKGIQKQNFRRTVWERWKVLKVLRAHQNVAAMKRETGTARESDPGKGEQTSEKIINALPSLTASLCVCKPALKLGSKKGKN